MIKNEDILSIVKAELDNAPVNNNLETPLEYYLGLPNGTETVGKSQLMSLDVADSVEWIMPQVMKSFTQTNEVVTFDPVGPQDELQAELESEYVYSILMKRNPGFVIIHQLVKDSLLQRNGVVKAYYKSETKTITESYTGLTTEQLNVLISQPEVEIVGLDEVVSIDQLSGMAISLYDVKIEITKSFPKICVESVAPEDFRVTAGHNSIDLSTARFAAQTMTKTVSELLDEGYDKAILKNINTAQFSDSDYRFQMQGETSEFGSYNNDESTRLITIIEAYTYIDIDNDGRSEYVKVTCAGDDDNPTVVLSVEELESSPWVGTTGILMSHKFQGLSIYDRLKEVQDNKTALIRNIMDNLYLQNNQRNKVLEGQVNIDDLMISRPGGNIRVKRMDAIEPLVTPQVGNTAFDMLGYLDEIRAGRTGVSAEGSATPQNIGDRVGSIGVERMMTAKEELVGLIIRVISETGIKPLCIKIRDLARKHLDINEDFKFRGQWQKVNPSEWIERSDTTVRVGTGSGNVASKLSALSQIIQYQATALQMPGQYLVDQNKVYSAMDEFCKLSGLVGANKYFIDPTSPQGQQTAQQSAQSQQEAQMKEEAARIEELRMQAELAKSATTAAEAQMLNVKLRAQVDAIKTKADTEKAAAESQIKMLESTLKGVESIAKTQIADAELEYKYDKMNQDAAIKLIEIEAKEKDADMKMSAAAEKEKQVNSIKPKDEEKSNGKEAQSLAVMANEIKAMLEDHKATISRPRSVIRDDNGKIIGLQ